MAREDKQDEMQAAVPDEALLLKKRARRRLIGAAALALFAAIILPMVMDHEPAPPLKDIQVRIPSPDEGVTQRIAAAAPIEKPARVAPEQKSEHKIEQKVEIRPDEPRPEPKGEIKPIRPAPAKPAEAPVASEDKPAVAPPASSGEAKPVEWEVQLGAYQEAGRVKLLLSKLNGIGVPAYTEKVTTANGVRTRVRAGPFSSQEAADKARERVRIIGVDGPVAQKP